jgi:AAA family ATP:ADP antiporter
MWRRLGRLERAIERLVGSDVHEGEWGLVLVAFANLFLLLAAYYILKVVREPLILMGSGAIHRSYARGTQALVLALAIPVYSAIANRGDPAQLVKWVNVFFVLSLVAFYTLGHAGVQVGFAFFVWLGIFSTMSIAQFWSLANDLMSEADGKRLFPMIAAGGTVGGIVGAQVSAHALRWLDPYQLMLMAAAALAGCVALSHFAHDLGTRRAPAPTGYEPPRDERGGFTLVLQDRYLLLIAASVVLLNLINTTGDTILSMMVNAKAMAVAGGIARRQYIGAFYGNFQTYVSVLTAIMQFLLVGRLFNSLGVARCLFLLPVFALGGYGASAFIPALAVLSFVKVFENSTDYSLQNTIQQALFLPTSVDVKYKAKAAIDTFLVRIGDLGSMALVFLGAHLGFSTLGYALVNVGAGVVWLLVVVHLSRRPEMAALNGGALRPAAARATEAP